MPAVDYVIGFECDLSQVEDVEVQEAVQRFAAHLREDNEHNRPLEHLVDLLGRWANQVTAAAAIEGESGRYLVTLDGGKVQRGSVDARFDRLRKAGIVVTNPQAEVGGEDPMSAGRPRQRLEAIDSAKAGDRERLLRALAHPANARGTKDAAEIRRRIFTVLTRVGGAGAEAALLEALRREDNEVIGPVIDCFVRLPSLMRELPDVLANAWREKQELVVVRLMSLVPDMELSADWLARAPADLVAKVRSRMSQRDVS
jgi:hypothetical protein